MGCGTSMIDSQIVKNSSSHKKPPFVENFNKKL